MTELSRKSAELVAGTLHRVQLGLHAVPSELRAAKSASQLSSEFQIPERVCELPIIIAASIVTSAHVIEAEVSDGDFRKAQKQILCSRSNQGRGIDGVLPAYWGGATSCRGPFRTSAAYSASHQPAFPIFPFLPFLAVLKHAVPTEDREAGVMVADRRCQSCPWTAFSCSFGVCDQSYNHTLLQPQRRTHGCVV